MEKLTLYTTVDHPRFNYTLGIFFGQLLGINTVRVKDPNQAILNYSAQPGGALQIIPEFSLWQDTIDPIAIQAEEWNNIPAFFQTNPNGEVPFDFLAASFYLISRYEEYLPHTPDEHGRYRAQSSVLVKNKWIQKPVVHLWAKYLGELIAERSSISFELPDFKFTTTLDIDQLYKFRYKGILRGLGGFLGDLVNARKVKLKERVKALISRDDPFYNFHKQKKWHQNVKEVIYFFLMSDHGKYDKNIHPKHPQMTATIQALEKQPNVRIGIHPGYASNTHQEKIAEEKERLDHILQFPTLLSRQHFLMMSFPETYQRLSKLGIREEYSMGYSTHLGFRAGIGIPYLWFNLKTNSLTNLRINPFCYMDITPLHYFKWTPEKTMEFLDEWTDELKKYGVHFQWLWHNESLSESERWENWRQVYVFGLNRISIKT